MTRPRLRELRRREERTVAIAFLAVALVSASALFVAMCWVLRLVYAIVVEAAMTQAVKDGLVDPELAWGSAAKIALLFSLLGGTAQLLRQKLTGTAEGDHVDGDPPH